MRGAELPRSGRAAPLVVAGGGMVGPVVAVYLARRFGDVTLLERRPDPGGAGPASVGRSVNVVLSARGWRVLRDLGLEEEVRTISLPLRGRLEHSPTGELTEQPYGRRGQQIWCVERPRLNRLLLDAAAATPGVHVCYGARVRGVERDRPAVLVEGMTGPQRLACEHVIGCDGAFSRVREALADGADSVRIGTLDLGYKEIRLPAGPDGGWRLPHELFHIWPRSGLLFSAFPNPAGDFTGSLFLPLHGRGISFDTIKTGSDAVAMFERLFPDLVGLIPDLAEQYESHPTNSIVTVRCDRWTWHDRIVLVGDSAHAMAPFMGQGMNCGFEDARILDECLAGAGGAGGWATALATYERRRKPQSEAIADISIQHYQNLASPSAAGGARGVLRHRVAGRLYDLFPEELVSLYERCAFTEEPYAEALRQHCATERLLDDLLTRRDGHALLETSRDELAGMVGECRRLHPTLRSP
jgi:kynurenine 3-monooxygenase